MLIIVKDVNDLPPKFEQSSYETTIYEEDDRHLPKTILQVHYICFVLQFGTSALPHCFFTTNLT